MLADILIPLLKSRYGGRPLVVGSPPDPVARFPAAHPDVGDLVIYHDDDELTVYLGNFTHVHVYIGEELTEEELSARIHAVLLSLLDDIFADRMEFFGSHAGAGRCRLRGTPPDEDGLSDALSGTQVYVWSGPV